MSYFDYEDEGFGYSDDEGRQRNLFGSDSEGEIREDDADYMDDFMEKPQELKATFAQMQEMSINVHDLLRDCSKPNKLSPAEKLACKISEVNSQYNLGLDQNSNIYNIVLNTPYPETKNPIAFILGYNFYINSGMNINIKSLESFSKLKKIQDFQINKLDIYRYASLISTIITDCPDIVI